jgi:tRNA G18 (ribose-2'-O)-methylase SpoU
LPVVPIDSPDDPAVADYRAVSEPGLARERELFVAEGRLIVSRLISGRRFALRSVLVTATAAEALHQVLQLLDPHVPVYVASRECLSAIAGVHIHRGCLALGVRPAEPVLEQVIQSAKTLVVLEGVGNADNVGGVFRNAAAFGASAVLLTRTCCDPLYRKAIRTSMGAVLDIPFATVPPGSDGVIRLKSAGFSTLAFSPRAALSLQDYSASERRVPRALFFGSEGEGLTASVRSTADYEISIPIRRPVDSLNVSVAVGIALSHLAEVGAN